MRTVPLVVYGGDDVGAGILAAGSSALWIRPPKTPAHFPVSYLGNGEVEAKAHLIFGDVVATRLWDLSRENAALQRKFLPGREVPVHWKIDNEVVVEEAGWCAEQGPALAHHAGTLQSVTARGNFRYELSLGNETIETSALVLADEILPPRLFAALQETWMLPACTELHGAATAATPEGLTLEHAGADYTFRSGPKVRCGSFRGLQDENALKRPMVPSVRGVTSLKQYYSDTRRWIDGSATPQVFEAALSCDGLPIVGPLSEAPGIFVVGAFSARERNFRTAAVKAVLEGLASKRAPLVEPYSPRRFS